MGFSALLAALLAASCVYHAAALLALRRFSRRRPLEARADGSLPGVSVLKPAPGEGPELAARLESHLAQGYERSEILVGIISENDRSQSAISRVKAKHPESEIRAAVCGPPPEDCNPKVHILENLAAKARYPVWLAVDADIEVPQGYLRTVVTELSAPGTGLVTCLYGAVPGDPMPSRLEACLLNTTFPAQVVLADWLQGLRFALGATYAVHSDTLAECGGLASVRRFIGDDFQIGARVASLGLRVRLSSVAVATHLSHGEGWREAWQRQLRWSRTIRMQRPLGHAGLAITHATALAALALLADPLSLWGLALPAFGLRVACALAAVRTVQSPGVPTGVGLLPLADIAALAIWASSYLGRTVHWSNRVMRLGKMGRIMG